jgi:hypothetical protein
MGGDYGEMREAEVGHGSGDGADVEWIARADEDYVYAVALGGCEHRNKQEMILGPDKATLVAPHDDELQFD